MIEDWETGALFGDNLRNMKVMRKKQLMMSKKNIWMILQEPKIYFSF